MVRPHHVPATLLLTAFHSGSNPERGRHLRYHLQRCVWL
jgi:hypothetical protein